MKSQSSGVYMHMSSVIIVRLRQQFEFLQRHVNTVTVFFLFFPSRTRVVEAMNCVVDPPLTPPTLTICL